MFEQENVDINSKSTIQIEDDEAYQEIGNHGTLSHLECIVYMEEYLFEIILDARYQKL